MQAFYPTTFEREVGCTEREWLMWLPAALGDVPSVIGPGAAQATVGEGHLQLQWHALAPRVIALVQMPRLAVRFRFTDVTDERRFAFMRRFDLYMQRGGG